VTLQFNQFITDYYLNGFSVLPNTACGLCTVSRVPGSSVVRERCVISAEPSDAYPSVFSSTVSHCLLFAVSLQPAASPALQGSLVAAAHHGSYFTTCLYGIAILMP